MLGFVTHMLWDAFYKSHQKVAESAENHDFIYSAD